MGIQANGSRLKHSDVLGAEVAQLRRKLAKMQTLLRHKEAHALVWKRIAMALGLRSQDGRPDMIVIPVSEIREVYEQFDCRVQETTATPDGGDEEVPVVLFQFGEMLPPDEGDEPPPKPSGPKILLP